MTEYPHQDGDFTVIGPECFAAHDGSVICWQGENYERQDTPRYVVTQDQLRELAYLAAGLASGAVMQDAPDVVMPTERISEGVDRILADFISDTTPVPA